MADHEAIARNKRRYSALLGQKLKTRRGAYQQKGFLSKKSKRRNRQLKIQQQQKHAK
jgi:hypothetical protein